MEILKNKQTNKTLYYIKLETPTEMDEFLNTIELPSLNSDSQQHKHTPNK